MRSTYRMLLVVAPFFLTGCLFGESFRDPPNDGNGNATTNNATTNNATTNNATTNNATTNNNLADAGVDMGEDMGMEEELFTEIIDVTMRDGCSLFESTLFVDSGIEGLPDVARIDADSVFNGGTPPYTYLGPNQPPAFSVAWVNVEGTSAHVVVGTAVVRGTLVEFEKVAYEEFNVGANPAVSAVTVGPTLAAVYSVNVVTNNVNATIVTCQVTEPTMGMLETACAPNDNLNAAVDTADVAPLREFSVLPVLNLRGADARLNWLADDYIIAGSGGPGEERLGALRQQFLGTTSAVNLTEILETQETSFFQRQVLGVSSEANRAPYLLALTGTGPTSEPRIMTMNGALSAYRPEDIEWTFLPDYTAEPERFEFVSSLDITRTGDPGVTFDTVASDAAFGFVAVLDDGSLAFSRPGGWPDRPFRRWTPPEPIEAVWTFDNVAWENTPGDPIIVARTETDKLMILRWNLNSSLEVIPDALAGTNVTEIFDVLGASLTNHTGYIALKVARGANPDLAVIQLDATRDFSDALCP